MKIHGTAKGGALSTKDFGVAFGGAAAAGFNVSKLVTYYKFDESVGDLLNKAEDAGSSDSNDVDMTNTNVTQNVTGLIDKAYDYDAADDISREGAASSDFEFMYNTTSGVFSFIGWVKPNATDESGSQIIFDNSNVENSTGCGLTITGGSGNRKLNWFLSKSNNTDDTTAMAGGSYFNTTDWRMIFVSWNSSNGAVQMSVDNGTKTTNTTTMTGNSGTSALPMSLSAARATPIYELNSICDEYSFWNRVLTDDEITSLYNSGAGLAITG
jgi:hypothetical protein